MGKKAHHPSCNAFANLFARLLGRTITSACGSDWQIELVEPPSEKLPVIASPVQYRLAFAQGLNGHCYIVFGEADVSVFGGEGQAQAGAADGCREALLVLLRDAIASLPEGLAANHGPVTIEAQVAPALDPEAEHALELKARDKGGASTIILLHFDPPLLSSFAMIQAQGEPGDAMGKLLGPANLEMVMDVELNCTLRFGQRQLSLREILDLASGSVVELDRQVDEPVELILDGRVIARGEAVVIDGNYGLRVTQVVPSVAF